MRLDPHMGKTWGVNPDENSGARVPKAVWCILLATPAVSLGPNLLAFVFPLDLTAMPKGGPDADPVVLRDRRMPTYHTAVIMLN